MHRIVIEFELAFPRFPTMNITRGFKPRHANYAAAFLIILSIFFSPVSNLYAFGGLSVVSASAQPSSFHPLASSSYQPLDVFTFTSLTSSDGAGTALHSFTTDTDVYANLVGSGTTGGMRLYVVASPCCVDTQPLNDVSGGFETVSSSGNVKVWSGPTTAGTFYVVLDADGNGVFDSATDYQDLTSFFVVSVTTVTTVQVTGTVFSPTTTVDTTVVNPLTTVDTTVVTPVTTVDTTVVTPTTTASTSSSTSTSQTSTSSSTSTSQTSTGASVTLGVNLYLATWKSPTVLIQVCDSADCSHGAIFTQSVLLSPSARTHPSTFILSTPGSYYVRISDAGIIATQTAKVTFGLSPQTVLFTVY